MRVPFDIDPADHLVPGDGPVLMLCFETAEAFANAFHGDIQHGGLFVPTERTFTMRQLVTVELALEFAGERFRLAAEVVHQVTPELTPVGATPGVAVQLLDEVERIRERLGRFAAGSAKARPDAERRAAPRARARLGARLHTSDGAVPAQTRDLSEGGALLSVSGRPVPVGDEVALEIEHPRTGAPLHVEARVVRHVEVDGAVAAHAVAFDPPKGEEPRFESFVRELKAAAHSRQLGGIAGRIEALGLASLVQMFGSSAPRGTLVLTRGTLEGTVAFESGCLVSARLGSLVGLKALARLIQWTDGEFEFHSRVEAGAFDEAPIPLDAAVLEAVRQLDELALVDTDPFPPASHLVVSEKALAAAGEIGPVEAALIDLARAGFSVQGALDVIPEPDVEIYRALESLVARRCLELQS
jgi:Tfp pilus assembly protein PilZ